MAMLDRYESTIAQGNAMGVARQGVLAFVIGVAQEVQQLAPKEHSHDANGQEEVVAAIDPGRTIGC